MSDQSWNFFTSRYLLIFLVVGSVLSSWTYFVLAVAKWNKGFAFESDKYQDLVLIAMLTCYVGLRKALARIATAPAGALDERDLELRNDAFRMAYLVIRRVGLAVLVLFGAVLAVNGVFYRNFVTRPSYFDAYRDVTLVKWLSDSFIELLDNGRGIWIILSLLITLTYCAYSFPLVILGWRQAIGQKVRISGAPEYENFEDWSFAMKRVTSNFAKLMISMAAAPLAMILLAFWAQNATDLGPFDLPVYLFQFGFFSLALWCLVVYAWSWLSMLRARHLYRSSQAKHLQAARIANLVSMIAAPLLIIGSIITQNQAGVFLAEEKLQMFATLASAAQGMLIVAVVAPSIAMVAAAVARRRKPEEAVEQATFEV